MRKLHFDISEGGRGRIFDVDTGQEIKGVGAVTIRCKGQEITTVELEFASAFTASITADEVRRVPAPPAGDTIAIATLHDIKRFILSLPSQAINKEVASILNRVEAALHEGA